MDRVSSIFARFEPTNSSRFLTSNVIGHVQPRASVGGGETAKIPPLLAALPSITTMQIALDVSASPQQSPLEYIREPSLSERKNNVAVFMSRSASPVSHETRMPARPAPADEPVRSVAFSSRPTQPRPKRASRTCSGVARTKLATGRSKYSTRRISKSPAVHQQEIPMLEMQHSRLSSNAKPSAWPVVVEYFHLFRQGSRWYEKVSSGPESWLQKSEAEQQLVFLRGSATRHTLTTCSSD
ncbi:hypothetical protein GN958_ATG17347 [Phytophthora infestans]|uniref:Uncharacterized protein n=1 Tax=Phytophthora infestans TaxID=4787 RepID=A0A8S9THK0_PHYIN|nr:hypothetical protein GN958_ATG22513 [Phytophthora infestans]KAF4133462.1 hypothetical protein GN958_ATG17347 [Phytophthora infestans]